MSASDIGYVFLILITGGAYIALMEFMRYIKSNHSDELFDFERDYKQAVKKQLFKGEVPKEESTFIGTSSNK